MISNEKIQNVTKVHITLWRLRKPSSTIAEGMSYDSWNIVNWCTTVRLLKVPFDKEWLQYVTEWPWRSSELPLFDKQYITSSLYCIVSRILSRVQCTWLPVMLKTYRVSIIVEITSNVALSDSRVNISFSCCISKGIWVKSFSQQNCFIRSLKVTGAIQQAR